MYSKNSFGNFYPVDSAVHRMNPIIKLLNFIITLVILIFSKDIYVHAFLLGLIIILLLLSFVPTIYYLKTAYSLRYLYIFIIIIFLLIGVSYDLIIIYIIKLTVFVLYLFLIIYTTSSSELIYAIDKMLFVLKIFKINTSKVAIKIVNMIKYIPLLIVTSNKILKSSEARGIDYNNGNALSRGYVLSRSFLNVFRLTKYNSKNIKRYNESKLFNITKKRTNYKTNKLGFYDIMITMFHLATFVAFLIERGYLNEILSRINI